jgi:hypothetical protein
VTAELMHDRLCDYQLYATPTHPISESYPPKTPVRETVGKTVTLEPVTTATTSR